MSETDGQKDGRKLYWYLLKVVLIATATRYPMYQVVSSLIRDPKSLVPCTQENPCNYVRVFPGTLVPGTGPQVIRVYNGMERPLFISEQWTHMFGVVPILNYSVIGSIEYKSSKTEAADVVTLADNGTASDKLREFWRRHPGMEDAMKNETMNLPDYVSHPTYFGMLVCRIVTGIVTRPSIWADEIINKVLERGLQTSVHPLQHIPSSYVSNDGTGATEAYCGADKTKDKIKTHMDHGLSFWVYLCSLAGWLVFTVLHDFSLLIEHFCELPEKRGCSLKKTALVIGCLSFVCQTVATGACFSWSSGTLSIFVAPGPKEQPDTVCFYRLQHLQAFFALGTPLFLHYLLMAQLQLIAASFVKGDFLYTDRYKLPFSYVAGTKTWEKGQRLIHDVVGRSASKKSQPESTDTADTKWYRTLWLVLCLMDYFFLGVQVLVISPAGMVITKSVAEYTVKTLHGTDVIPKIVVAVLCTLPCLMFVVLGVLQCFVMWKSCYKLKACCGQSTTREPFSMSVFELVRPLIILICWAAGMSFWPFRSLLNPPQRLDLFHAELWGNAGVALFLFGIAALSTNFFGISQYVRFLEALATQQDEADKGPEKDLEKELEEVEAFRKEFQTAKENLRKAEQALQEKRKDLWKSKKSEPRLEGSEGKGTCSFVNCVRGELPGFPIKFPPGWHHELVSLEDLNPEEKGDKERCESEETEGEQSASLLGISSSSEQ